MIYFVQGDDGGPIKIGTTKRLSKRIVSLRREHCQELRVLAVLPGGRETESELHNRFASLRIKGEWFLPSAELRDFIETSARPWDESDDLKPPRFVGMRGSPDWKKWLDEYAEFRRMTVVALIDRALEEDAAHKGFKPPPKR